MASPMRLPFERALNPHEIAAILGSLTDGIQVFDAAGEMIYRNAAAERLFGIREDRPTTGAIESKWEVIAEDGELLREDLRPLAVAMRTKEASEGRVVGVRNRADGHVRWLSVSTVPIFSDGVREVGGYVSCARDLTDRMETIRGLKVLTKASSTLGGTLDLGEIAVGLTTSASDLCSSPGERPRRAVLMTIEGTNMIMSALVDPTHSGEYPNPVIPISENPYVQEVLTTGETLVTRFEPGDFGSTSAPVIEAAAVRNAALVPLFGAEGIFAILAVSGRQASLISDDLLIHLKTLANMGALAFANAKLHQHIALEARTDSLTGLGNRRALRERYQQLGRWPFALIAIDVDYLKLTNDSHGHDSGDELLRGVADVMKSQIRPSDILARTGGDEFVALLVDCDELNAAATARRLVAAVSSLQFPWGPASISVGFASGGAGADPNHVLNCADAELYRAKATRLSPDVA